jgi:serine/threonine protein kinase/tetratricopeptide (TPR) repeat protein
MPADDRLRELLQRWQQSRDNGLPLSVDELCQECPDLVDPLRQLIRVSQTPAGPTATIVDHVAPAPGFLDLAPGVEPVNGYKLISLLGRGSFGQVWKAVGPGGFSVAIKCVPLDEEADSAELRSLELMKDIHHANILPLFGAWQGADMLVVAMELGESSLLDRCNEYRRQGLPGIPRAELLEYTRDAAKGIDFLNEPRHTLFGKEGASIQHRDIKPQNLLLVGNSVKVADFGLAKFLEQNAGSNSGSMTAAYAAPECFRGKTSNRSDQYSLGVTYCQLRGGRLPFEGSHVGQIMMGHVGKPPDLSMIPEEERPALIRALAKDPEDRWPSCRAFVQALTETPAPLRTLAHEDGAEPPFSTANLPTPISSLPTAATNVPVEPAAWQARPPRRRSERVAAVAIGFLGVVMLATGAWLGWHYWQIEGDTKPSGPGSAVAVVPTTSDKPTTSKPEPTKPQSKPVEPTPTKKVDVPPTKKVEPPPTKKEPVKTKEQIDKENAVALDKKGLAALEEGKRDDALGFFDDAVKLDPENALYYYHRGRAHFDMQQFKKAIADFDWSIKKNNNDAAVYAQRGRAYAECKEFDKAIEDFNRSLDLEKEASVLTSRGTAYAQLKNPDKAVADYTEALRLNDRFALAYRNRGVVYSSLGKYTEAIADLDRAIEIDPNYAQAYGSRGRAHFLNKNREQALADYNKALELDRNYVWAYNARGQLHAQRREWKEAIADYSDAIQLDRQYIVAYENRARAYDQLGMKKEAAADRSMVKKLEAGKGNEER